MKNTADKWFILETNYDHWLKPFFLDDRRTPANNCMRKLTQKVRRVIVGSLSLKRFDVCLLKDAKTAVIARSSIVLIDGIVGVLEDKHQLS